MFRQFFPSLLVIPSDFVCDIERAYYLANMHRDRLVGYVANKVDAHFFYQLYTSTSNSGNSSECTRYRQGRGLEEGKKKENWGVWS